jgi:hypothetical protein
MLTKSNSGLWLGTLAFAIGGVGEALLFSEEMRGAGLALLGLGLVAGVVAWRDLRDKPLLETCAGRATITWRRGLAVRLAGIALASGLSLGSVLAYLADPNAIFGLQGVLWLAGICLLLVSCSRWYSRTDPAAGEAPPWTRTEGLLFAGLVALSLVTHLAFLQEIPWRFHFDEGYAYTETMRYYRGPAIPLFTTTWFDTGLPSLWFAIAAGWMRLVGPSLAGVRMGVAFIGAVTVIPVYGLARLAWGRMSAGLAGFAVAVSAADVHYSRVSINNITTAFSWAVCFYFLLRGLRSRRPGDFVWSGLAAGTGMYTYYGTRLLPVLLVAFVAYLLLFHFRAFREQMGHFALLGLGFLAGFGPLIGYFVANPGRWLSRTSSFLNVPAAVPSAWQDWVRDWNILAPLAGRDFLGLSVMPGKDTVYYAPLLLPPEAMLLVIGVGLVAWRWRQPASFLVLLWGLGVVLTGGLLLDYTTIPNFAHWAPAFPAFYLALALPLSLWLGALLRQPQRPIRVAGIALVVALLVLGLGANAYAYLVQYPSNIPADHALEALQGRFLAGLGPGERVRIVGTTWQKFYPDVAEMMAPQTRVSSFLNPSRELPLVGDPDHDQAFLFYDDMYAYLPVVRAYYPGGQEQELKGPDGHLVAKSYVVPAAKAMSMYGVRLQITDASGSVTLASGHVPRVGALLPTQPKGSKPPDAAVATWSGAFYLPGLPGVGGPDPVTVSVGGVTNAALRIQGRNQPLDTPLRIEPGWVMFAVQARVGPSSRVRMLVKQGNLPPAEPDAAHLWPTQPDQGLLVTLSANPAVYRVDSFVGNSLFRPFRSEDPDALTMSPTGNGGSTIRWEGEISTGDGAYGMSLRTDAKASLEIDGTPVVRMCVPPNDGALAPRGAGQVQLKAGWHKVRLDFEAVGLKNGLEWFWTPPGGTEEAVPPEVLRTGQTLSWPEVAPRITCP